MNPIDGVFADLKKRGGKALIPFLTAGDPSISASVPLAKTLIESGANVLEIGFPYSDPIADGPVIQASYTRALNRGLHLDQVFSCAHKISEETGHHVPLVAMVSFSIVHRRGSEAFIQQARQSGFSGAIVPDLPVGESATLCDLAAKHDFKLIHLVTPTTSLVRAKQILQRSTGFVYCVSVAGITGERTAIPAELLDQLRWLREQTPLPLCVGFGISTPAQVRMLHDHSDGIIVGSAFVRHLEPAAPLAETQAKLAVLAQTLREALDDPS